MAALRIPRIEAEEEVVHQEISRIAGALEDIQEDHIQLVLDIEDIKCQEKTLYLEKVFELLAIAVLNIAVSIEPRGYIMSLFTHTYPDEEQLTGLGVVPAMVTLEVAIMVTDVVEEHLEILALA